MANVLSAIVAGTRYRLDDGNPFYWVGDDGLGMAPLHRLSERSPVQHGETDLGFRLDPRNISIILDTVCFNRSSWEQARAKVLDIFKPSNTPITLELELNEGTFRIDTYYIGQMTMPSVDRIGWSQKILVQLKAPDPTFYKSSIEDILFALGGGSDTMEVPTTIPMTVGASSIDSIYSVNYEGTFKTYPSIRIKGAITDPVIENTSTGLKLDFTGVTIAAGDYYDIDLRFGYKTVVDSNGDNQISKLVSESSDLVDFAIEPAPTVPNGNNSIRVTGTGITENTEVRLTYYNRFVGR